MVDLNRRNSSPPRSEDFTNRVMMYCDKFFRYLRNLSNKPVPIQIGVGASSGFVLSYFFTKGSKICALLLGCSFILLQFFNYRGYIRFNRGFIRRDVDMLSDKLKKGLGYRQGFPNSNEVDDFLKKYAYLFTGFFSGNLIGYGMA